MYTMRRKDSDRDDPARMFPYFNVMHHMIEKACTIWSREIGVERNPADQVEVRRPDDTRDRYLSEDELGRLKRALDEKKYRKGTNDLTGQRNVSG